MYVSAATSPSGAHCDDGRGGGGGDVRSDATSAWSPSAVTSEARDATLPVPGPIWSGSLSAPKVSSGTSRILLQCEHRCPHVRVQRDAASHAGRAGAARAVAGDVHLGLQVPATRAHLVEVLGDHGEHAGQT